MDSFSLDNELPIERETTKGPTANTMERARSPMPDTIDKFSFAAVAHPISGLSAGTTAAMATDDWRVVSHF